MKMFQSNPTYHVSLYFKFKAERSKNKMKEIKSLSSLLLVIVVLFEIFFLTSRALEVVHQPHKVLAKEMCENISLSSSELPFGGENKTISQVTRLTWGKELLEPILCVSKFVVLYENSDKKISTLCSSFDIVYDKSSNLFYCLKDIGEDNCNQTVNLIMEIWINNHKRELLQSSTKVKVLCTNSTSTTNSFSNETLLLNPPETEYKSLQRLNIHKEHNETDDANAVNSPLLHPVIPLVLSNITSFVTNTKKFCSWTQWTEWGHCSITCGDKPGTKIRTRSQRGSKLCIQEESESKKCYVNKCPQDCAYDTWSSWSSCSQSCGTGTKQRSRTIKIPNKFGGRSCVGGNSEIVPCSVNNCAVDGSWSEWSRWSYCDKVCGYGKKTRTRQCNNPMPENDGKNCTGINSEIAPCRVKICDPIDGNWSRWSRWSGCDKPCGPGNTKRTRICDSPMPEHGGKQCQGNSFEKMKCFLKKCISSTDEHKLIEKKNSFNLLSSKLNKDLIDKDENNYCTKPLPYISGFIGPLNISTGIELEQGTKLRHNEKVKYICAGGYVLNERTNENYFMVSCSFNGTLQGFRKSIPMCKPAKYCLGKPKISHKTIPRRDLPINDAVHIVCNEASFQKIQKYGSCFSDGIYRFPKDVKEPCLMEFSSKEIVSESISDKCKGEFDFPIVLNNSSYGWIQYNTATAAANSKEGQITQNHDQSLKPINPFLILSTVFDSLSSSTSYGSNSYNTKSNSGLLLPKQDQQQQSEDNETKLPTKQNCKYKLKAPLGYAISIGIEKISSRLIIRDNIFGNEIVRTSSSFVDPSWIPSKSAKIQTTSTSSSSESQNLEFGSEIELEITLTREQSFRINYRVVEPYNIIIN